MFAALAVLAKDKAKPGPTDRSVDVRAFDRAAALARVVARAVDERGRRRRGIRVGRDVRRVFTAELQRRADEPPRRDFAVDRAAARDGAREDLGGTSTSPPGELCRGGSLGGLGRVDAAAATWIGAALSAGSAASTPRPRRGLERLSRRARPRRRRGRDADRPQRDLGRGHCTRRRVRRATKLRHVGGAR